MIDPDELDFAAPAPSPEQQRMVWVGAFAQCFDALDELICVCEERDRYRAALVEIARFSREHPDQPTHIAWHHLTVDIPEICRVALEGDR